MKTTKTKARVLGHDSTSFSPANMAESSEEAKAIRRLNAAMEQRSNRTPHLTDQQREAFRQAYQQWLKKRSANLLKN